jgi:hypothetical protein
MAYTYNPSYSGGRDQEIAVQSQPGQTVPETLSWEESSHTKKGASGVAQSVGPEFKPQYCKKINKNNGTS